MSGDTPIGDDVTVTISAHDGSRVVTVRGPCVSTADVLAVVGDALRGAGFYCPPDRLRVVPDEEPE